MVHKLHEYSGHVGSIYSLAVNGAQTTAYTSGDDGTVAAWNLLATSDEGIGVMKVEKAIYALCSVPDFNWLIAGMSDGTVHFIDPQAKQILHTIRKITEPVYNIRYESERQYLWVLYGKGYLSVIRLPDFEEIGFRKLAEDHLRDMIFSPIEPVIFFGASDHRILAMNRESGIIQSDWVAHDNSVFSLAIDPKGRYLLSGGRDAHLNVWEATAPYAALEKIPAHNFTINDIAFSPDGKYFMTASRDKTLKLWDANSLQLLKVIDMFRNQGHRHSVNRVVWLKDGTILSAGDDRRLIRWGLTVGAED